MIESERPQFAKILGTTYDLHGKRLNDDTTELWWAALSGYDFPLVRAAFSRHIQNPDQGQYCPKPADIIREIGGTTADASLIAGAQGMETMRRVGSYESVQFVGDPIIHRVLQDLGGWCWLGEQQEKELPFIEKRFRDAYRAWRHRGLTGTATLEHLPGRVEIGNNAGGHRDRIPKPVQIGVQRKQIAA